MGAIDVATVVGSIIAALGSGLDVFHRLGGKKRPTHARLPHPSEEEEWLRRSLKGRPVEIRKEYEQSVAKYGHAFEVGDDIAHASLAHTLLVLNTGLINLISHALADDSKTRSSSKKTLFNLSETAAVNTITALGQLTSRLSIGPEPRLPIESDPRRGDRRSGHGRERKACSSSSLCSTTKHIKRPPPGPLLMRGGWVRSKSGSSVVTLTTARKARENEPTKHKRNKSESNLLNCSTNRAKNRRHHKTVSEPPRSRTGSQDAEPTQNNRQGLASQVKPNRQPSMLIVPADFLPSAVDHAEKPPPRPPKIPLDAEPRPQNRIRRKEVRPVSTMTFMTTSTKIGEIPESRWPNNDLSLEELKARPMPYVIPPPLEATEPKRKKGFRFWKREDKLQDVAAH
ncbi:hypothetical protein LTR10_019387 [Elasticomyces elasticus]|uniref:Uncharacterized protein n=1 Tax=Exophiala sideris TaxID=1016849 RepID=A0ABR0IVD2_9EURO|nr:hypothetical protein LTR10_019387 [Elasticomyces elasticus]KAK5021428.1 hypothetical protein LTS07_011038 [Exophiala sideris]KAK5025426.1 hypothetical protein LTR13_010503 [Exophiala sideris]KAK5049277.1 hypothetical protein LTR69_011062 [Exophiala sideris]KAK5176950.1 hypothetical protein LTR44_010523 [Eurotiomycetes sp. CCFEE 6388]